MATAYTVSIRTLDPYSEAFSTSALTASRPDVAAKRAIETFVRKTAPRGWKKLEIRISR